MRSSVLKSFIFLIVLSLGLQGCKCKRDKEQPHISPSVKKEVSLKLNIQRFEKDLFAVNIDSVEKYVPLLKLKYGEFFDIFNYKLLGLGSNTDRQYPERLKRFLTDSYMNMNYTRVTKVFSNIEDINQQLTDAFGMFHEYFPGNHIPRVFTCISGWNQSVVTADTILAIALDKYLGRNCDFYEKLRLSSNEGFAKYLCYTMEREYIVPDCMRAWGYMVFEFTDSVTDNVLNNMLYEGKIAYFVKKMMPLAHDTLAFGFSPKQLKWCNDNTKEMWTYLVEHKLLFSTDYMIIRKLIYPAPFTSLYNQESPGRATVWVGYKIIEAYMKNNVDVTLPQLMKDKDYQKILRKSNFKP